jgi:anti-sigma regulatory factor (Ser/Thr protein kinase)
LPGEAASVARGRHWIADQLAAMYAPDGPAAQEAQVVVSELVTNSVQAGCREVVLTLEGHDGRLTVAVTDDAPGLPIPRTPPPNDPRGRGLLVVGALSQRWGVHPRDNGKTVWAEIAIAENAAPTSHGTVIR